MIQASYRLLGDSTSSRRSSARWVVAAVVAVVVLLASTRSSSSTLSSSSPSSSSSSSSFFSFSSSSPRQATTDVLRDVRPSHPDSTYKNPHALEAATITDRSQPVHIVAFCRLWTTHAFGGMAQVAYDRFEYGIKHHNWKVDVITTPLRGERANVEREEIGGMTVHYTLGAPSLTTSDAYFEKAFALLKKLEGPVHDGGNGVPFDVAHMDGKALSALYGRKVREHGTPLGITWHGTNYDNLRTMMDQVALHGADIDMERALLELKYTFGYIREATSGAFDYQVATATHGAADLVHLTHLDNVWTIFNGMDTPENAINDTVQRDLRKDMSMKPKDFLVLLVGRLNTEKGTDVFLAAVESLLGSHDHIKFAVVGDGSLRSDVETMAQRFPDNVLYLGPLAHKEVISLLPQADLALDPSIQYHAFNNIVPEALCSGTLVLGTTAERLVDEFDDGAIWFADLGSPASLAAKMVEVSELTPRERERHAKRVKDKWCPRFSLEHSVRQYDDLYRVMQMRKRERERNGLGP